MVEKHGENWEEDYILSHDHMSLFDQFYIEESEKVHPLFKDELIQKLKGQNSEEKSYWEKLNSYNPVENSNDGIITLHTFNVLLLTIQNPVYTE